MQFCVKLYKRLFLWACRSVSVFICACIYLEWESTSVHAFDLLSPHKFIGNPNGSQILGQLMRHRCDGNSRKVCYDSHEFKSQSEITPYCVFPQLFSDLFLPSVIIRLVFVTWQLRETAVLVFLKNKLKQVTFCGKQNIYKWVTICVNKERTKKFLCAWNHDP